MGNSVLEDDCYRPDLFVFLPVEYKCCVREIRYRQTPALAIATCPNRIIRWCWRPKENNGRSVGAEHTSLSPLNVKKNQQERLINI